MYRNGTLVVQLTSTDKVSREATSLPMSRCCPGSAGFSDGMQTLRWVTSEHFSLDYIQSLD